jgi:hypothetical protein
LYVDDIENLRSRIAPVELIIAAFVLEYGDTACAVTSLKNLCLPDGKLVILLQDSGAQIPPVSPSPYTSLEKLAPFMRVKKADDVIDACQAAGFALLASRQIALESGKRFSVLAFKLQSTAGQARIGNVEE